MTRATGPFSLERVVSAVEKVRQRLLKAAATLNAANVPYAVAGGNAVALWVSRVDEAAVRNTQDVDVLIRRGDFDAAKAALESAGFVYRHSAGIDAFLEIQTWHEPLALFRECAFIVASRPGHSLADVANALPETLRPKSAATEPFKKHPAKGDLVLPGVTVHLLDGPQHAISATAIREVVKEGKSLGKLVEPTVADYIKKQSLYRP